MTQIGKEVRLGRIFNKKSGNALMVAMDHGVVIGPVKGIVDPKKTVAELSKDKPDTFFMPAGIIKQVYQSFIEHNIPYIAAIDSCLTLSPEPDYFFISNSVDYALKIGASAVSMHVLIGPEKTTDMLKSLARVAEECDRLGMPLLAIMYPSGFKSDTDVELVKWAARIAAELGADIVKTYYTGNSKSFREVIEACPIPVMLSGGEKQDNPKDFFKTLRTCIDCGARGAAVGRNLWQAEDPSSMLKASLKIIHENASVEEALNFLK